MDRCQLSWGPASCGSRTRQAWREADTRLPGRPLVLIAHSHGGSVALGAISESVWLQYHVAVLCCLATPFLHCTPRRALLEATRPFQSIADARDRLIEHARRLTLVFRGEVGAAKLHVWRVSFDEAAWWLRTVDFLSYLVGTAPSRAIATLNVAAAFLLLGGLFVPDGRGLWGVLLVLAALTLLTVPVVMVLVAVVGGLAANLWRAMSFAYGEDLRTTLSSEITTRVDPPAGLPFTPHGYSVPREYRGLRHSVLYSRSDTAESIARAIVSDIREWRPPAHDDLVAGSRQLAESFAGMRFSSAALDLPPPEAAPTRRSFVFQFLQFLGFIAIGGSVLVWALWRMW